MQERWNTGHYDRDREKRNAVKHSHKLVRPKASRNRGRVRGDVESKNFGHGCCCFVCYDVRKKSVKEVLRVSTGARELGGGFLFRLEDEKW